MTFEKRLKPSERYKVTMLIANDVSEKLRQLAKHYSTSQTRIVEGLVREHRPNREKKRSGTNGNTQ